MEASKDASYYLHRKCWRKKGYSTTKRANKRIKEVFKEQHLRLYKYKCSGCGEYHLTKQPSARGRVI